MNSAPVGISNIHLHIPDSRLPLEKLISERVGWNPKLGRHLDRAIKTTGQKNIRFPRFWEDSATMAAQAAHGLIKDMPELRLQGLRYLAVGTESGLDHSKPLSAFVEGMLDRSGLEIPTSLASFQVQHACAAGTLAMLSVGGLLSLSPRDDESGIVVASDIARYKTETTAEITQGAGAAALLLEKNPKLIELDLTTQGYCSRDVDDFFRPLGSKIAQVQGRYSMEVYKENLEAAFEDHAQRRGMEPSALLTSTDFFVLHAPFRNMPVLAMKHLLEKHLGMVNGQTEGFLESRGFFSALDPIAEFGNTYTASLYVALAYLLADRYHALGEQIVGKSILLASYGSGNTLIVLSGRIAAGAPSVIRRWDLPKLITGGVVAGMEEYRTWVGGPLEGNVYANRLRETGVPANRFYLGGIREDGYREYQFSAAEGVVGEERREERTAESERIARPEQAARS